jgi:uncharacterized oligopeptide transporter (OPT) family protein
MGQHVSKVRAQSSAFQPLSLFRMSIQSALLGKLLGLMFKKPFTASENVMLQTTAVATGTMPLAAGFVGIIPALGLLDRKKDGADPVHFDWATAVAWSFAIAFFG